MLNGSKRWIGNATFAEIVVVWARNLTTKQINAFVVRKGTKGFKTSKIENKIALRCVQNADITLTDVFVPDSARLTGVNSFQVASCSASCCSAMPAAWCAVVHMTFKELMHSFIAGKCSMHQDLHLGCRCRQHINSMHSSISAAQLLATMHPCHALTAASAAAAASVSLAFASAVLLSSALHSGTSCFCAGHKQGVGNIANHGCLAASGAVYGCLRHVRAVPEGAQAVWDPSGSLSGTHLCMLLIAGTGHDCGSLSMLLLFLHGSTRCLQSEKGSCSLAAGVLLA